MSTTSKFETYQDNLIVITFKMLDHAKRQAAAWMLAGICMFLFQQNYQLGFNRTESLPYTFFVIHKNEPAKVGDIVAFKWDGGGKHAWMSPFPEGSTMVKLVMAGPGEVINADNDGMMMVNGHWHQKPKPTTKAGKPLVRLLEPGAALTIPANKFYVGTDHYDGFDSRYEMVGLIDKDRFLGRVHVIF